MVMSEEVRGVNGDLGFCLEWRTGGLERSEGKRTGRDFLLKSLIINVIYRIGFKTKLFSQTI
jgi:hypothetical protein